MTFQEALKKAIADSKRTIEERICSTWGAENESIAGEFSCRDTCLPTRPCPYCKEQRKMYDDMGVPYGADMHRPWSRMAAQALYGRLAKITTMDELLDICRATRQESHAPYKNLWAECCHHIHFRYEAENILMDTKRYMTMSNAREVQCT